MNRFMTLVVGGALFAWGLYEAQQTLSFKTGGAHATGKVIAAKVDRDAGRWSSSTSFAPVVEFVAADGKRYQFISAISSSFFDYKLDAKVPVLYKPASPSDARIDGFLVNWMSPILLLGLGGWGLLWVFGVVRTRDGESPLRSRRDRWYDD